MKRPFADKRPLGPFAQSERFTERVLGDTEDITVDEGDRILLVFNVRGGVDEREISDRVDDVLADISEFVVLEAVGDGEMDTADNGAITFLTVASRVDDPEVTLDQLKQAFVQGAARKVPGVAGFNIAKLR